METEVPTNVIPPVNAAATTTPVMNPTMFRQSPVRMICPQCQTEIITKIEPKTTKKTHILALSLCAGLCLFACCCFAPIVYLIDECKAKEHKCPNCQAHLGMYDKILGSF